MEINQHKAITAIFSIVVLLLVMSPVVENWSKTPTDNFPLSYYPMFSKKREAIYTLRYVVGYDEQQQRHLIPYHYIGNGGFNQVRRQIIKQCKNGKSKKLAKKVARRLAKSKEPLYQNLERIEVVKGTYNFETYFVKGDKTPLQEKVLCTQIVGQK
jgi:hypothetical protein